MRKMLFGLVVSAVFAVHGGESAAAQDCDLHTPYMVLPLFKAEKLGWLENENRIDELCPDVGEPCRTDVLTPQVDIIPLYDQPGEEQAGALHIAYTPGQGMSGAYTRGGMLTPFTPSVYDADWGYGPWFHATLLEEKDGGWKRIALPDGVGVVWVNLPDAEPLDFLWDEGKVYKFGDRSIVMLSADTAHLEMRDAQPVDMWCGQGKRPVLQDYTAQLVDISVLYDAGCNLRLSPAHPRGC